MGRFEHMYQLRQMRAGLPHGSVGREGQGGVRVGEAPWFPALSEKNARPAMSTHSAKKVSVATVWLDGCSGCHMSFLDMDERLIALATTIEIVYSPIVDTKTFPEQV